MIIAAKLVILVTNILFALLVVRAVCTWLFQFNSPLVEKAYEISCALTEFLVKPCRKLTDRFSGGMFDWSVLLACLVLILARDVLLRIITMI